MSDSDKKVYAIRNLGFWYDDEYYRPLLTSDSNEGRICSLCEDKQAGIQEWKLLEYEFSRKVNFENVTGFDGSYYVLEQLGFDLNDNVEEKIKLMNQDELFDLIQKLDRHVFFMYEHPADLKIKTLFYLWDNTYASCDVPTDYGEISNIFLWIANDIITINGSLEELSDTPLLLSQLIKNNPNIKYNEDSKTLEIDPDEQSLISVNALLKKPLYEIRYLTIKEIYEIEQTLNSPNNQVA